MAYCPKCKSLLYPQDEQYMSAVGVCSYCVTYDNTPDKRYQAAYAVAVAKEKRIERRRKGARKTYGAPFW